MLGESGMGFFFHIDEGLDFALVIEEVAKGVENLSFGQAQGLRDFEDGFTTLMEGRHVTNSHPQAVNDRLAPQTPIRRTICGCSVFTASVIGNFSENKTISKEA